MALAGRPNVGKSTLLNGLLGTKVAIVSNKPQTTRSRILGVQTIRDAQLLWLDVPGLHANRRSRNLLNERMLRTARDTVAEADVIVLVLDATTGVGRGDLEIYTMVAALGRPWMIALNKIDLAGRARLLALASEVGERFPGVDAVPVSGRTGENLDELVRTVARALPEGPPLRPADDLTDQTARRLVEEYVREKIFEETGAEIPYRTAVLVESFAEREDRPVDVVHATILVDRDSHKRILVGRGGHMIRTIGMNARRDLEQTLGRRLHLELFVKVREDWTESPSILDELGV